MSDPFKNVMRRSKQTVRTDPVKKTWWMSIDPGWKNCGIAVGTWVADRKSMSVDVECVETTTREIDDKYVDPYSTDACLCLLFDDILSKFPEIDCVLIEKQYYNPRRTPPNQMSMIIGMQLLQTHMYSLCRWKYNKFVAFVDSKKCKTYLGIATGDYRENKEAALAHARGLDAFPGITHHVADAICQIDYFLHSTYSDMWVNPKDPQSFVKVNWQAKIPFGKFVIQKATNEDNIIVIDD